MGREIRRVPPNWKHPKYNNRYRGMESQPMFNRTYADAVKAWKAGYARWESRDRLDKDDEFWDHEGPPPDNRAMYRPWTDTEATWWQVWETVSEGTPVSPPFATPEELVDYLAAHGDFWDQQRGTGPWDRTAAERFVKAGWAPSFIVTDSAVTEGKLAS